MRDNRRKRVTYRPGKGQSIFGGVVGVIFVLIGLFVVIPGMSMAGGFGVLFGLAWTAIAAGIAGMNFYQAFGKGYVGPEISIEDEGDGPTPSGAARGTSAQERLTELRALYDQRLITQEEYEEKRKAILKEL